VLEGAVQHETATVLHLILLGDKMVVGSPFRWHLGRSSVREYW